MLHDPYMSTCGDDGSESTLSEGGSSPPSSVCMDVGVGSEVRSRECIKVKQGSLKT